MVLRGAEELDGLLVIGAENEILVYKAVLPYHDALGLIFCLKLF